METISRNIDDLRAFHMVASERSFTKAAESMGTSKAMVSKQVKRLETYMKTQLFLRTTRTLSLTEQGTALFNYSQKIFELSDEASVRLRDMSEGMSGIIKISTPVSLGEAILPSLLAKAKKLLPEVKFEIDLSNETKDFMKDGIDFALRATDDHHPDLIARPLGQIKDVICATPEFIKQSKIGSDPRELKQHQCILHTLDTSWNTWTLTSKTEDIRLEVGGSFSTNQYPMAHQLCLKGLGIVRIPLYLVAEDLKAGRLVTLFPDYEILTHPLYLVYMRNEYATKKQKITRDLILEWFKDNQNFFLRKTRDSLFLP